ncbi:MAG TPA: 2'-5' RNA ligase family protein, partial [Candidatus Saccharimonadales bacterium]|nr:2'-5' RNA ligase family protein [Candidatus Saccharimonadales bacterium]
KMAIDHFGKRYAFQKGHTDWNFNIMFDGQPQVAKMAAAYAGAIDHPGLYPPIPAERLHMTVLRVGFTTEYTDAEMAAVTGLLRPKLAGMEMPELVLGPWWIWGGPVLHVTPEGPLIKVFDAILKSIEEIVGKKRTPKPQRFIPHVTLAYCKDYDDEIGLHASLSKTDVEPARFRADKLSMIKQWPSLPVYKWDVVEDIPIGQAR